MHRSEYRIDPNGFGRDFGTVFTNLGVSEMQLLECCIDPHGVGHGFDTIDTNIICRRVGRRWSSRALCPRCLA